MDYGEADALNRAIRLVALKHRARATSLLGQIGLHPGQEILLLELEAHGPQTQIQLAGRCDCEAPTITQLAQKLEANGLISREPSSSDGRATVVDLTDKGRALLEPLRQRWLELAESTVAGLAVTDKDQLLSVTRDLAQSLSSKAARQSS